MLFFSSSHNKISVRLLKAGHRVVILCQNFSKKREQPDLRILCQNFSRVENRCYIVFKKAVILDAEMQRFHPDITHNSAILFHTLHNENNNQVNGKVRQITDN